MAALAAFLLHPALFHFWLFTVMKEEELWIHLFQAPRKMSALLCKNVINKLFCYSAVKKVKVCDNKGQQGKAEFTNIRLMKCRSGDLKD